MEKDLYEYLEEFMIENNWENKHVPEQARAFFTTLCFTRGIDADTALADSTLSTLYFRAAMEEIMEYEDFENFMVEFIV